MNKQLKYSIYDRTVKLFILLLYVLVGAGFAVGQHRPAININEETSLKRLLKQAKTPVDRHSFPVGVENARPFEYNRQLRLMTPQNRGDVLALDFFDDRKYKAVIQHVAVGYDGASG